MRSNQLGFNMDQYLNLKIGAKRRLEILRQSAKTGKWVQPMTWKNCRFGTFKNQHSLDWSGDSWYTFEPGALSRQKYADEACKQIDHGGWYTDSHYGGKARGIVVNLPHGRFIAGYEWSDNGEVVYYPEIFEDARELRETIIAARQTIADDYSEF